MHVEGVLRAKGNAVVTATPDASLLDAAKLLRRHRIGALVVTSGEHITGIVTERDYARKIVLHDRSSKETLVGEVMSKAIRYVRLNQTTDECMTLMTENRIRHLPVIDGGLLIGMVSIGDLVKNLIAEQQFTIHQLEHYIRGNSHAECVRDVAAVPM